MIKKILKNTFYSFFTALTILIISGCVGPDYQPDLFGLTDEDSEESPDTDVVKEPPEDAVDERNIVITKLITKPGGRQTEAPLPSESILEIGTGTFIAEEETDIGSKYMSTAKFKILNVGSKSIDISIPPHIGPFYISSPNNLKWNLSPKQFITVNVDFIPTSDTVAEEGRITEELTIGNSTFQLVGMARAPSGQAEINIINNDGETALKNIDVITFPEVSLSSHPLRQFFKCETINCDTNIRFTNCVPCLDMISGKCELLIVNEEGNPVDEVDSECNPRYEGTNPATEINLLSTEQSNQKVQKRIIEIQNSGPEPLIIDSIKIDGLGQSDSDNEFALNKRAIFMADSLEEIETKITSLFDNSDEEISLEFPTVLPPFDPPSTNTKLYLVISYHPKNISGSDGSQAAVGSSAKDEASLVIKMDSEEKIISLAGTTTIREIPSLQLYVKTSTGLRPISNGETLPYEGITVDTTNLAMPLFMRLSEGATTPLKISSITMTGENFEWLNASEKINNKPEGERCTIPILDDSGSQTDIITDLNPVSLNPNGFTLEPEVYNTDNMPLFGCINFNRDPEEPLEDPEFQAEITVTAQELTPTGNVATNPDGSAKETTFRFFILGVIDPLKGQLVLRINQTMAAIMNQDLPSISSLASEEEMKIMIENGEATKADMQIFLLSMYLDPFDEKTILDKDGNVVTTPKDGITGVFYPIDTRAIPETYEETFLEDYTSLVHDALLDSEYKGVFTGFPNVPESLRVSGLRIFTGSLSYPGPVAPPEEQPQSPSQCEKIDPCTTEGQKKLGQGSNNPAYTGVCAFFYTSAGDYHSPAFHYPDEEIPGNRRPMCKDREEPRDFLPVTGKYYLNGRMEFENAGLLFQGPTYFHSPDGPLPNAAPLDEMFHLTFTTETIIPRSETKNIDRIPDRRVNIAKGEYKINLNDPFSDLPQLCKSNKNNRFLDGEYYSSWKYIAPLLKKDKEGTIPAGCPEEDNDFTGGMAYIRGKRVDHKTGHVSVVSTGKFSSKESLTFAFKDVMFFLILNGWFCDPIGPEEEMEGAKCYDRTFNYRDAQTQYSIME